MNWLDSTNDESVLRIFTRLLDAEKIKYTTYKTDNESDETIIDVELNEYISSTYLDYLFRTLKITYGGKNNENNKN